LNTIACRDTHFSSISQSSGGQRMMPFLVHQFACEFQRRADVIEVKHRVDENSIQMYTIAALRLTTHRARRQGLCERGF